MVLCACPGVSVYVVSSPRPKAELDSINGEVCSPYLPADATRLCDRGHPSTSGLCDGDGDDGEEYRTCSFRSLPSFRPSLPPLPIPTQVGTQFDVNFDV